MIILAPAGSDGSRSPARRRVSSSAPGTVLGAAVTNVGAAAGVGAGSADGTVRTVAGAAAGTAAASVRSPKAAAGLLTGGSAALGSGARSFSFSGAATPMGADGTVVAAM